MNKTLFVIAFLISFLALSQEKFTISGYVQEESSGENLIGVSIYENNSRKGTSTNQYGFYSLTLNEGTADCIMETISVDP